MFEVVGLEMEESRIIAHDGNLGVEVCRESIFPLLMNDSDGKSRESETVERNGCEREGDGGV